MKFWIKERNNPQLGTYYVAYGKLPAKEAMAKENPLYGSAKMHGFTTKKMYEATLASLKAQGFSIQDHTPVPMKTFKVDVRWHAHAVVTVEAKDKADAKKIVHAAGIPWDKGEEADDGDGFEVNVLEDDE